MPHPAGTMQRECGVCCFPLDARSGACVHAVFARPCLLLVCCRLNDLPDVVRRAELPAITVTSYEMMKRLTCAACQKLQGAAAAAGARAAAACRAEAAATTAAAAAAVGSEGAAGGGDNNASGGAVAQASGGGGRGCGASGRGRGRGRGFKAHAPMQDSVASASEDATGCDVQETAGCRNKPGGVAGKRCQGCTGPGEREAGNAVHPVPLSSSLPKHWLSVSSICLSRRQLLFPATVDTPEKWK